MSKRGLFIFSLLSCSFISAIAQLPGMVTDVDSIPERLILKLDSVFGDAYEINLATLFASDLIYFTEGCDSASIPADQYVLDVSMREVDVVVTASDCESCSIVITQKIDISQVPFHVYAGFLKEVSPYYCNECTVKVCFTMINQSVRYYAFSVIRKESFGSVECKSVSILENGKVVDMNELLEKQTDSDY